MNLFLVIILVILVGDYVLGLVVDVLNVKHLKTDLPVAFSGYYDEEKYKKSQQYLKENTRFELITGSITTPAVIAFILLGGFNWVDQWAQKLSLGPHWYGTDVCRHFAVRFPDTEPPLFRLRHFCH